MSEVLHTPRLILRTPTLDDTPRWEQLCQPFEVARHTLRMPHPYPPGGAAEWFAKVEKLIAAGEAMPFGIFERQPNGPELLIGMGGLHDINATHKHAELGYTIGLDYWGKGYATEAAAAIVDHGFLTRGLDRIHAGYFTRNVASGRILEKLGFKQEALREHMYFRFDEWVDLVLVRLLRPEWEAARASR